MLVRKAEILVFLKLAGSISQADECLLDLVRPLAESALKSYMQQSLERTQHIELFPTGQPQRSSDFPLDDVDFRSGGTVGFRGTSRTGTEFLQLKNLPVLAAGLEVYEDVGAMAGQAAGSFDNTETELVAGVDFNLDIDDFANQISRSGILYRVGAWPVEPRAVKVSYFAGFSSAELAGEFGGAVKLAALQTVAACFWNGKAIADTSGVGPKISEHIGKYGFTNSQSFIQSSMTFQVPMDARLLLQPFRNYGRCF